MKPVLVIATLVIAAFTAAVALSAAPENSTPTPFQSGERLRYEVVWPSGLTLGEAEFTALAETGGWTFTADLSANLPNYKIQEHHRSRTDGGLCSVEFQKDAQRGARKLRETITFDQDAGVARRETDAGGGVSEIEIPPCARDGLTFLYFLRQDLARGRIPPPDDLNFGSQYAVTVTYAATRRIQVAGKHWDADLLLIDLAGPGSSHTFEIFFSKDAARKPLIIRVPFQLGTFSLRIIE